MADPDRLTRRAFLARIGLLGAVVGGGGALVTMPVWATDKSTAPSGAGGQFLKDLVDLLRPVLDALALDTLTGLAVFALPGPDPYSRAQGTASSAPGAVESRGGPFLIDALDRFVPFPDELARPLAAAFSTALADIHLPVDNPLNLVPVSLVDNVDKALAFLLQNDQTIPLSLAVALMLNSVATSVNPLSAAPGAETAVTSPFSRLTYAQKAKVFQLLEGAEYGLISLLDAHLPPPLRGSVSGLVKFVGGSLLEFAAFGSANEWGVYDPTSRTLTARPVSWQLSGYSPNGVVDGWDEFKGYYQGRRQVADV